MSSVKLVLIGTSLAIATALLYPSSDASADGRRKFSARLSGLQEVPAVSTPASGSFEATLSRDELQLDYELTVTGLSGQILASHIHLGRTRTNGGIMVFLCDAAGVAAPTCVQEGTVSGTVMAADVIGPTGQLIRPGEFEEVVRALRADAAYVNVHTSMVPSGEMRGQVGSGRDDDE